MNARATHVVRVRVSVSVCACECVCVCVCMYGLVSVYDVRSGLTYLLRSNINNVIANYIFYCVEITIY